MEPNIMKNVIAGMLIVSSGVMLLSTVGGVQQDTIEMGKAFVCLGVSFLVFLLGFFILSLGE